MVGVPDEVTHPDQVPLTNTQGEVVDVALGGARVFVEVGGARVAVSVGAASVIVDVAVLGEGVLVGVGSAGVDVLPGKSQARTARRSMIGAIIHRFNRFDHAIDFLLVDCLESITTHCTCFLDICLGCLHWQFENFLPVKADGRFKMDAGSRTLRTDPTVEDGLKPILVKQ